MRQDGCPYWMFDLTSSGRSGIICLTAFCACGERTDVVGSELDSSKRPRSTGRRPSPSELAHQALEDASRTFRQRGWLIGEHKKAHTCPACQKKQVKEKSDPPLPPPAVDHIGEARAALKQLGDAAADMADAQAAADKARQRVIELQADVDRHLEKAGAA